MPFPSQRRDHAGPSEFTSSPKRIAVLYYCPGYRTRTPRKRVLGHVRQLALKIKEGAEAAGAEVDVFQVVDGEPVDDSPPKDSKKQKKMEEEAKSRSQLTGVRVW